MDFVNALLQLLGTFVALFALAVVFLCFVVSVFGFLIGLLVVAVNDDKRKGMTIALCIAAGFAILLGFVNPLPSVFLFGGSLLGAFLGRRCSASDF